MKKGLKITIIIFCIVIAIFIIDSAQALIFNNSPIIKVRKYYDGGTLHYKDGGLFVDTYCGVNGIKDTVIKGFSYSLTFDEKIEIIDKTKDSNITCDTALEKFYEDAENTYYYSCIKSEYVIVKYSDGSQETVEEALAKEKIKISDLDKFDIHYIKESKYAIGSTEENDVKPKGQDYFNGIVLDINDDSIKVKCLDVTKGNVTEGTELNVTKNVVSTNGVPSIKVGDTIRVVYTGIRETYPPQLQTVFAIYLVDESGKVIPNQ